MVSTAQTQLLAGQAGMRRSQEVLARWGALAVVCLATLMLLMDFMAVSVALPAAHLPSAQDGVGASFSQLQWVLEAFVLTLAAFVLTAGHIADLAGRRPVFLAGLAVFAAGSLVAGLSQSAYMLIAGRVVQGVGGALAFSTGTVLLSEMFGRRGGRLALAVWGTVTGLAVAASPVVGGVITKELGWRWIFLVEAPAAAAALLVGLAWAKEPDGHLSLQASYPAATGTIEAANGHPPANWQPPADGAMAANGPAVAEVIAGAGRATASEGRQADGGRAAWGAALATNAEVAPEAGAPPDWRGLALFSAAIAILVVGLVRTTTTPGEWSESGVLACFACTGLLLVAFVGVESVSPAPMLEISLFRYRTFTGSCIAAFGLAMAVLGPFMLLVLYLAYDLRLSPLAIGTRLLLLTGMTLPMLVLAGWLDRYLSAKSLICAGLALVTVGLWLLSRVSATSTWAQLVPGLLVAGAGFELVSPRLASVAAATVRPHLTAVAARTTSTFRQLGTATGLAVLGSVFVSRLTGDLNHSVSPEQGPAIANLVLQGRVAQAAASAPGGTGLAAVHQSFADAMHEVFLVAALVALGSTVLALAIRSRDVPRQSLSAGPVAAGQAATSSVPAERPKVEANAAGAGVTRAALKETTLMGQATLAGQATSVGQATLIGDPTLAEDATLAEEANGGMGGAPVTATHELVAIRPAGDQAAAPSLAELLSVFSATKASRARLAQLGNSAPATTGP
ncbi:MAG: MFS transporter, partial [Acidimicrobiales bacterium]